MKKPFVSTLLLLVAFYSTSLCADSRVVIPVSVEERDAFLSEMRAMLDSSQRVLAGALSGDMDEVYRAAKQSGMIMARNTPDSLRKKLPQGFKEIGPLTHRGFENIAIEAKSMADKDTILEQLAELQKACLACHKTYQIKVEN